MTEGFTGRSFELKAERSTVGRLEDNNFQIPAPSVSSHHCEILLRGNDVVVKDLDSTNGTFINGEQVTEATLPVGQTVRFGSVEARLEASAPTGASGKKVLDKTAVLPQGVKMNELEQGTQKITTFDKNSPFKKKSNTLKWVFIGIGVLLALVIIGVLVFVVMGDK
ncbi:MAG: FHA domain containing protein [Limisphaerales bacterium]|nr:MAG: FHA domain containing protein [Limisphaerales bacterium]KAG0507581.1 MAG: FHA domain containing protein [Limisphaerales bacterium]TXT48546.1 MAG: FHA domain containing protein [Limisphaerales bacterium]